jgi:hypothetical protein
MNGTTTTYIEPGSPWENPFVESFNGRVRDELLNVEDFASLLEAEVVVEAWRTEYNTYRPHSSLAGLTPVEFRARWLAQHPSPGTPEPPPDPDHASTAFLEARSQPMDHSHSGWTIQWGSPYFANPGGRARRINAA